VILKFIELLRSKNELGNFTSLSCLSKPDLSTVQMSRTKVDYMDATEISSDASPELFGREQEHYQNIFGIFPFSFPFPNLCSCEL
jgi:hypothetical protein